MQADAETVKQRIFGLKQVLAQAVLPMPSTPGIQKEMEHMMDENRRLRDEVERLKVSASYCNDEFISSSQSAQPLHNDRFNQILNRILRSQRAAVDFARRPLA
jgi:hypothetical protein